MSKRIIILFALFVLVIAFATLFFLDIFYEGEIQKEIQEFGEDIIYQCQRDRDCVSTEILGCCPNKTSINKKYRSYWRNKQEELELLRPSPGVCTAFPCSMLQSGNPRCVARDCKLIK